MPEPDLEFAPGRGAVDPAGSGAINPTSTLQQVDLTRAGRRARIDAGAPRGRAKRARLGVAGSLAVGWLVFVVAAALLAPILPLDDPTEPFAEIARQGPGAPGHILGGDNLGRDMLSRLVWGARSSLLLSVSAVLLGL